MHINLATWRRWTAQPFLRASRYDLKWRNYANCTADFSRKARQAPRALLNHIEGARCLGLKKELCWRLRAYDLVLGGGTRSTAAAAAAAAAGGGGGGGGLATEYFPQCWDLRCPADFYCFVANFTASAAFAVLAAEPHHDSVSTAENAVEATGAGTDSWATPPPTPPPRPDGAGPCHDAVRRLRRACEGIARPAHMVTVDPELICQVLAFGTRYVVGSSQPMVASKQAQVDA